MLLLWVHEDSSCTLSLTFALRYRTEFGTVPSSVLLSDCIGRLAGRKFGGVRANVV